MSSEADNNEHLAGDRNVELEDMGDKKPSLPIEGDIMQLARLGEIAAIQKLFDAGTFDATFADEQGITALHVRLPHSAYSLEAYTDCIFVYYSGPQLTTTTPSAISLSKAAQTSTQKAEMQSQHQYSGPQNDATTISSISSSSTAPTLSSPTTRASTCCTQPHLMGMCSSSYYSYTRTYRLTSPTPRHTLH
jgi:hypothetical protein